MMQVFANFVMSCKLDYGNAVLIYPIYSTQYKEADFKNVEARRYCLGIKKIALRTRKVVTLAGRG